jgi:hypothetical protein
MLHKQIGKEYSNREEREAFLKDNCDRLEKKGYMKPYTPEELQGHKENLASLSIRIDEIEERKKETVREFKLHLHPLLEQRRQTVYNIRQKAEYVHETCYTFIDREERKAACYNVEGDLIELRPATVDELQPSLFTGLQKTGTNY